ncbi:MAG: trypsin-like peptidase domain-containing protein [Planctomycetota bacterium]|nr:trypsin-like peptidase domain-containing protein [Planctomycetota bacterium]
MRILPPPRTVLLHGVLAVGLLALLLAAPLPRARADEKPAPKPDPAEEAYEDALERAEGIEGGLMKSVNKVRINSVAVLNLRRRKPAPNAEPILMRASGGSGVIIKYRSKLWILTNVHVTAGHHELQVVTHDGVVRDVEQHDSIPEYDIALLRFKDKLKRVKFRGVPVVASKSLKGLKAGTWVIATGSPFFLGEDGRSVTTLGVISGMDRFLGGQYQYVGAIQHDAEVNPGNSGGPLWDLKGNFIGINGKIAMSQQLRGVRPTNTGAAFSLPVHQVEAYLKRLVGDGDAEAGYLGVQTETETDKKGKAVGAKITKIERGSPLGGRGAGPDAPKVGDVITSLIVRGSGKTVYTASDLREHLSLLAAGQDVTIKFKRSRRTKRFKVRLADRGR